MKKLLISLSLLSLALSAPALDITGVGFFNASSLYSNLTINGDANNEATVYCSSGSSNTRILASNGKIIVSEGTNAVIDFRAYSSDSDLDGDGEADTTNSAGLRFGGSNKIEASKTYTVSGGAGSELTFYGLNFDTGATQTPGSDEDRGTKADDTLKIENITFNIELNGGTNKFGSNNLLLENATVNFNKGIMYQVGEMVTFKSGSEPINQEIVLSTTLNKSTLNITADDTVSATTKVGNFANTTLTNSTLNISRGTNTATTVTASGSKISINSGASLSATSVDLSNASTLSVETGSGTLTTSTLTSANSTISVSQGATLNISGVTSFDASTTTFDVKGTLNAVETTIKFDDTKVTEFSGGIYNINTLTSGTTGNSDVYINAKEFNVKAYASDYISGKTYYIGLDKAGNIYDTDVNVSAGTFQHNANGLVLVGNSSITASKSINLSTVAEYEENADGNAYLTTKANYIGKDASLSAKSIRICGGYVDGTVTVNKGYVDSNSWNYTLALGTINKQGTVEIGANADITVYGNASSSVGKNFTICGDIISNAATGAIKSDANAGFFIRSIAGKRTSLTLNSVNAFAVGGVLSTDADGNVTSSISQADATFKIESNAKVDLIIAANNDIGTIEFGNAGVDFSLSITDGNVLTIKQFAIENNADGLISVILKGDIEKGMFKIVEMDDVLVKYGTQDSNISFGDRVLNDNLYLDAIDGGGYWVYTVQSAVPEPAQWATILGMASIAFVMVRRRIRK